MSKYKDQPTILQKRKYCKICGREFVPLEHHHVFEGSANRRQSAEAGLWVWVCRECHEHIHNCPAAHINLKQDAQRTAMKAYDWDFDDWRERFGKNYL